VTPARLDVAVVASANPFRDATVGSLLDALVAGYPDAEGLVLGELRLTFAAFLCELDSGRP
jgi:hypothetical protein